MRSNKLLVWIFLFPVLLFAQEGKSRSGTEVVQVVQDLGVGREFDLGKTSVSFIKVISDSRCPRKVTCIWPGEARVLLGIKMNGKYLEKELVISGGGAEIPLENELILQVIQLSPYPESGVKIAAEAYCLRLAAKFPAEDQ